MTPQIPDDVSGLTKAQVQGLTASLTQSLASDYGLDFITAWKRAKAFRPDLFARLERLAPQYSDSPASLSNDFSGVPQLSQDSLNLLRLATPDESSAAWRINKNSFDPGADGSGAKRMFDGLIDLVQRKTRMPFADANADVRTRFPALSALADANQAAATLQAALPPTVAGADSRVNRGKSGCGPDDMSTPAITPRQPTIPAQKAPLDFFRVAGIGNDRPLPTSGSIPTP